MGYVEMHDPSHPVDALLCQPVSMDVKTAFRFIRKANDVIGSMSVLS